MLILVTDDAKYMRLTLGNILRRLGHEVIEAENGLEAVEKYVQARPDLVTMDVTMPAMGGLEAVRRIKEIDPAAKIIMVSAMGQKHLVGEAIHNGAADFIVKPFKEERIKAILENVAKGA